MKHRKVFKTADIVKARAAVSAARQAGALDEDIWLIAREDIELQAIPEDRIDASTDMVPAALRGALGGGATGLVAGLVALVIPPIGMTIAGAGLLTAAGGLVGTFMASLAGASLPNEVRQKFASEIEAGAILVVVDIEQEHIDALEAKLAAAGAQLLPFDALSALS